MGKGVILPSVTQPIAHSPLVVLTNLSRWPVTGLERIQTNPIPTATRYSRQVRGCATGSPFHTPFSGTKQQWGQKIVVLLVPWVGRSFMSPQMGTATQGPGDAWEPSAALACRELGSGTHRRHPPLQPLAQLPAGTTAELPLPSFQPLHQKEKKKKKKMEKATGATARSKYQCYHLSLAAAAFRAVAGVLCFVRYLQHGGTQRKGRSEATVRGGGWEHQLGPKVLA